MIGGIVGAAAGVAGGLLGGFGKNRAIRKQIGNLEREQSENQNWFDRRYNEDATQRADAQRLLTMTADRFRNRNRQDAAAQAVMGATNEVAAANKAANNQALSDTASQIAASGAARKDAVESQYMARKNALGDQINALKGQQKSGWDIASDAIGGGAQGFMAGMGLDILRDEAKNKKEKTPNEQS